MTLCSIFLICLRPSVKDLLNHEFFAEETGLKVEVASRDEAVASANESVNFRLRVLDPKKRRDKHKENEAIEFEFNVVTDDADKLAQDMVHSFTYSLSSLSLSLPFSRVLSVFSFL